MSKIIAAFCGTGKTYLCDKNPSKYVEFECWKYSDKPGFPANIIRDIKRGLGENEVVFISTNPVVLKELNRQGVEARLVYPDKKLKAEYIARYVKRGSHKDFIDMLGKHWDNWIDELAEQTYCEQTILGSGEFIKLTTVTDLAGHDPEAKNG
jgi:hypothetical protein